MDNNRELKKEYLRKITEDFRNISELIKEHLREESRRIEQELQKNNENSNKD